MCADNGKTSCPACSHEAMVLGFSSPVLAQSSKNELLRRRKNFFVVAVHTCLFLFIGTAMSVPQGLDEHGKQVFVTVFSAGSNPAFKRLIELCQVN